MDTALVKTTQDGRPVEVRNGWVCLAGQPEADRLVPLNEHPNREAIARAVPDATHVAGRLPLNAQETEKVRLALAQQRLDFDASPAGIAQRLSLAIWAKSTADGVE